MKISSNQIINLINLLALHFISESFYLNIFTYRISSYSFRGNYSFLNLEIQRSQYIRPKVTVHKGAETIQGRKLYEEIRYLHFQSLSFHNFSFEFTILIIFDEFYAGDEIWRLFATFLVIADKQIWLFKSKIWLYLEVSNLV